jgi:hypothetical protein
MVGYDELKALWIAAGGAPAEAPTAAAVALAESAGNPQAMNKNTNGSMDVGLWQINFIHKGAFGLPATVEAFVVALKDPATNARAAVRIKAAQGWNAWVAYKNGKHKPFMR